MFSVLLYLECHPNPSCFSSQHDESIAQKDRHIEALERQLGVSDAEYQRFKDERDAEDALAVSPYSSSLSIHSSHSVTCSPQQQHRRRAAELREQQAAIGEEQAAIDKAADERFVSAFSPFPSHTNSPFPLPGSKTAADAGVCSSTNPNDLGQSDGIRWRYH